MKMKRIILFGAIVGIVALTGCAPVEVTEGYSDVSTPKEAFYTTTEEKSEYEPSTAITEPFSAELVKETTTSEASKAESTTERKTIPQTTERVETTTEEARAVPGDYIGRFTLTAYEWTGEPMANGEYPYYGVCASNYFALGTTLYIDGYGTFIVKDRGSSSMGYDIIDIYVGDEDECWEFGVRTADVYYG